MSSDKIAIRIANLSKRYEIYETPRDRLKQFVMPSLRRLLGLASRQYFREFWALRDVSFEVKKGETVGIIGRNGSGKSTLLQIICGTLSSSEGSVVTRGRIAALLELGSGFNPEFTGRENVYMNAALLGLSKDEVHARFSDIATFADIGQFIEQPVKTYSSGMLVRLAFAVAINVDPEILIVDEALSVGDELFQRKCFSRIEAIKEGGATILFVSHSGSTVVELCDQAVLIDSGEKLAMGDPKKIVGKYQKFLYCPQEKREIIREQISCEDEGTDNSRLSESTSSGCMPFNQDTQDFEEVFVAELVPASTINYESHGAIIGLPEILTMDTRQVNHLIKGKKYRLIYTVEFADYAQNVHFSMMLKAVNGVELSGVAFPAKNEDPLFFDAASKVTVEFVFACKLLPGVYYVNVGCRGVIEGEEKFLHRIVDAACFRVLPGDDLEVRAGYFDCIDPVGYKISPVKVQ